MKREIKNKRVRRNGFVLIAVIAAFALIAAEIFILTGGSNVILFQANNAYLQACRQNLTQSASAWAELNAETLISKNHDEKFDLDTSSLYSKRASLQVKFDKTINGSVNVQIETTCEKATLVICDKRQYKLIK